MAHGSTSDSDRAVLLAALADELSQPRSEESTARAVTHRALDHVSDADCVSITLRAGQDRFFTVGATDDLSERLDHLQYELGEGPCVEAADGHDWYRSGEVGVDPRWPRWGPRAHQLGAGSLLSVRLVSGGSSIGALNFYSLAEGRFDDREELDFAVVYSTHVAIALANIRELSGLETAIHNRHLIGVAQGILIERFGLDLPGAFDVLRRYSSSTNTKLAQVAEEVVRTGRLPDLVRAHGTNGDDRT
ncbi:GAF and ANTAR domain-containing protein [Nocardioides cavernae]|uniref:GAF and ANTAR domain-containing protein n=1 Tax=Nocardioides cavernae TaxID=1921566 RepID=A0ABR8NBE8_9ACTN|nr:GAF and ANTAR domain-containing protein [Nocardioides cavernae]MBD3924961.1 GAF and ANTAR domain-containing protein [Nocardioides cavernae]MBM7514665.1 GAF domain-containing protein [Nocardioides cavernae]